MPCRINSLSTAVIRFVMVGDTRIVEPLFTVSYTDSHNVSISLLCIVTLNIVEHID